MSSYPIPHSIPWWEETKVEAVNVAHLSGAQTQPDPAEGRNKFKADAEFVEPRFVCVKYVRTLADADNKDPPHKPPDV